MADKQHKNGEAGAPEPDEVTEVTQAVAPADAEPAAPGEETTAVIAGAGEETTQTGAGGDDGDAEVTAVMATAGGRAACAACSSACSSSSRVWRSSSRGSRSGPTTRS